MRKISIPRMNVEWCMMYDEVIYPQNSTFYHATLKFMIQLSCDNVSFLYTPTYNFGIKLPCLLFDIQVKNSTYMLRRNFNVGSSILTVQLPPYCQEYTRRPLIFMLEDNAQGRKIVQKMNMNFWEQSLSQEHCTRLKQQARRGLCIL